MLADLGYRQGWTGDAYGRVMADIDHDGSKEIVGFGPHGIVVSRSTGDGGFSAPIYMSSDFGFDHWGSCKRSLVNLNGDDYLDVVAQCGSSVPRTFYGALGSPVGFGAARAEIFDYVDSDQLPQGAVAFGDVDKDGKEDLVALNAYFFNKSANTMVYGQLVARSSDSITPPPPAAPSNLHVTGMNPTTLNLTWSGDSPDVRWFRIDSPPKSWGSGRTTVSATGLQPDTQYCFTVTAVSWWGVSAPSSQVCGRTDPMPITKWVDLTPAETYLSPSAYPDPGEELVFSWKECITGTTPPGAYTVTVYHDDQAIYSVRRPAGLPFGCFYSESVWFTAEEGDHDVKVVIDSGNEVNELVEGYLNTSTYPYDAS
ncbi:MAG: hypothetical protein FJ144_27025, partial [Deltaproteobacteria bacterium]|nr:hypothetical protein [Deltaproteobacteria bacterium]